MRIQLILVPLVLATAVGACGGTSSTGAARPAPRQVLTLEGFPLDRTLGGLASWRDLDAVVVVSDIRVGAASWTTAGGSEPAYITEGRAPSEAEGARNDMIVTDFTASIDRSLLSNVKSDTIAVRIPGGSIGNVDFVAGDEAAPALSELNGTLLLAGSIRDGVLHPAFAYRVDAAGQATSLLASASIAKAEFSLDALRVALLRR